MNTYQNPLETRYASEAMRQLFSEEKKFTTFRQCWTALAEAQKELGLNITDSQIQEMKDNISPIDFDRAKEIEKEIHHDVMSHIRTFGEAAPEASGIIHLGATSAFVNDNTNMIIIKEALEMVRIRMLKVIKSLREKAFETRNIPVLGYTHLQPAQPTTLGKRISLWLYDLTLDFQDLEYRLDHIQTRGAKGTTGTQASYLKLFGGDSSKVEELDRLVSTKLGFPQSFPVTGQTVSRKIDYQYLTVLSSIAQTAHKAANDFRLMQHQQEIEEPFGSKQVGSSAMPYKRNPILAERMTALSRFVINHVQNAAFTYTSQFLERTLDDSANRRLSIPESFLAVDSILILFDRLISGMNVYPKVIQNHLIQNLPFFATENILMKSVDRGGDRQILHEKIRTYAMKQVQSNREGGNYSMLDEMKKDSDFPLNEEEWNHLSDMNQYTGRAEQQVEKLIKNCIDPLIQRYRDLPEFSSETRV